MSTRGDPRVVRLDDQTKSILHRAIAREQSLSRLLMTYVVTGLYSCSCPARFLGGISSKSAAAKPPNPFHQLGFRRMATPSCSVGWARSFWESGFTRYRSCES
jgi:hypothetical protein